MKLFSVHLGKVAAFRISHKKLHKLLFYSTLWPLMNSPFLDKHRL